MTRWLALAVLAAGCATTGPRPMPAESTAAERLTRSELALSTATGLSATFEIEATGAVTAKLTGTLDYAAPDAVWITAEGQFGADAVRVELDSRKADGVARSTTKGASASSHHEPRPTALGDAVTVGLMRMGLLHNLATLVADRPLERTDGTVREWIKALDPKDGGPAQVANEACHRVTYALEVSLKRTAEMTVCLSDTTSLLVERHGTVHFEGGDMQVTERYRWTVR